MVDTPKDVHVGPSPGSCATAAFIFSMAYSIFVIFATSVVTHLCDCISEASAAGRSSGENCAGAIVMSVLLTAGIIGFCSVIAFDVNGSAKESSELKDLKGK